MKNSTYKLLVTLLVLVILIGGGVLLYQRLASAVSVPDQLQGENSQTTAPDFTVTDPEGVEHTLSNLRGKPVVVNFWASWCGPCKMEMPHFQKMWQTYGDEVEFMMVNLSAGFGDTREKAEQFWASWCGPCKMEMPHFQKMWQTYGDEVEFMMVNLSAGFGDTREKAEQFLADGGYTFPVYYDEASQCAIGYGLSGVPMTVFVDAEGYIQNIAQGMLTEQRLESAVESLLAD